MSRPQSSRQTTINNALVRPRLSDLNQLASAKPGALQYVFVAIDRATRWVFIQIKQYKTAAAARAFLAALKKAACFHIRTILTDNGKEFSDRLFGKHEKQPSGDHEFDLLCKELGIEHRLTRPRTPRTNGMVERFNGRLSQVLHTHRFNSAEDLEKTLHRFVWLYNQQIPQKALRHETPVQALKRWQGSHPTLFEKNVRNHPGPDTYPRGELRRQLIALLRQGRSTHRPRAGEIYRHQLNEVTWPL